MFIGGRKKYNPIIYRMSESPPQGLVIDYSGMTPIPVIKYDSSSNAIIFDNPMQTTSGIASSELAPLSFNSPAVCDSGISAGVKAYFLSLSQSLYHPIQ